MKKGARGNSPTPPAAPYVWIALADDGLFRVSWVPSPWECLSLIWRGTPGALSRRECHWALAKAASATVKFLPSRSLLTPPAPSAWFLHLVSRELVFRDALKSVFYQSGRWLPASFPCYLVSLISDFLTVSILSSFSAASSKSPLPDPVYFQWFLFLLGLWAQKEPGNLLGKWKSHDASPLRKIHRFYKSNFTS